MKTFVLSVLLLIACVQAALGTRVELPIPEGIKPQGNLNWCWAASIQFLLKYYKVEVSQEEVVMATWGRVEDLPIFDMRQAVTNLFAANAKVAPEGLVIHPYFQPGAPIPAHLLSELKDEKSPVFIGYHNFNGVGRHAVVCYGVEYRGTAKHPTITKILVWDPWDGQKKAYDASLLAARWEGSVILRVAPPPPRRFLLNMRWYTVTPTFEALNDYGIVEGRVFYCNALKKWMAVNLSGVIVGPIE